MLDKSIPYKHILMKRPKGTSLKNYDLPVGFSFCKYKEGNERQWAEIEASVAEFDDTPSALNYYNEEFLPHVEELKRRQVFIQEATGRMAATITAWWKITGERRDAVIHWVAVRPEYQGRGLGKALVAEGIKQMQLYEGDVDIYLHTQTWSYKAINIYLDAGFEIFTHESFGGYKNEYDEAMEILGDRIKRA